MTTPGGSTAPRGRRDRRGATRSTGLPGAFVAIALVVAGSIVALGVADITPSSALPAAISASRVPSQTTATTPPTSARTSPPTTVRKIPAITPPRTADTTTHVVTEPKVSLQDDKGDTINPNADDNIGSDGTSSKHPSRHPRDS